MSATEGIALIYHETPCRIARSSSSLLRLFADGRLYERALRIDIAILRLLPERRLSSLFARWQGAWNLLGQADGVVGSKRDALWRPRKQRSDRGRPMTDERKQELKDLIQSTQTESDVNVRFDTLAQVMAAFIDEL